MKGIVFFALILLGSPIHAQVYLVNDGAVLKISNTANVNVTNGHVTNKNSGQINNDGTLELDLDFTQNTSATYTGGATSWLGFEGSANQNMTSDAAVNVTRLHVDNGNRLILNNQLNISTTLDLDNNGSVQLGTNNVIMASGSTITNYDASNYVITDGTGILQREVGGSNVEFPVGNGAYNPAILNNSGTIDDFQVRVVDQVLIQGTTGSPVTTDVVDRTWMIDEVVAGGSNLSMTLQWISGEELGTFDRTNSGVSHHISGTTWDEPAFSNATNVGVNTWTQTRSGFTSFSPFTVSSVNSSLPVELIDFEAIRRNQEIVDLTWNTASELNNSGFYIERMIGEEGTFQAIDFIEGNGTTSQLSNYRFADLNDSQKISYYRLKQVDFNGNFEYSETRSVQGNLELTAFPNPTSTHLTVVGSKTELSNIELYTLQGKCVTVPAVLGKDACTLSLEDLQPGVYLVRTPNQSFRVVKQ